MFLFNLFDMSTWEMPVVDFNFILALVLASFMIVYLVYSLITDKTKMTTKDITRIALFAALSFVLNLIKIVKFPQGGGISLVQFLPILVLGVTTSRRNAIYAGLVYAFLNSIGGTLLHPIQIVFDYFLPPLAISLIAITKENETKDLVMKSALVFFVVMLSFCLSGVTFFASYAPVGQNVWIYSLIYNFSSSGVDLFITLVVLILSAKRFIKLVN